MSSSGFLKTILVGFTQALGPVRDAAASPEAFAAFLKGYGWVLAPADVSRVTGAVGGLGTLPADPSTLEVSALAAQLASAAKVIRNIASSGAPAEFASTFPRELLDDLVYSALADQAPSIFGLLHFAGVFSERRVPASATSGRAEYIQRRVDWSQLSALADHPAAAVQQAYGWGGDFDADSFLRSAGILVRGFGGVAGLYGADPGLLGQYFARDSAAAPGLKTLIISAGSLGSAMSADTVKLAFLALPIPPASNPSAAPDGLALMPVITGQAGASVQIAQGVALSLTGDVLSRPVRAELHPDGALLRASVGDTHVTAAARLDAKAQSGSPWIPLGTKDSSRLEIAAAHAAIGMAGVVDGELDFSLEAGLDDGALFISFAEADAFVRDAAGSGSLSGTLSLVAKWSSKSGFSLSGGPKLSVVIPMQKALGPVILQSAELSLGAAAATGVELDATVSLGASIGPLKASIAHVGVSLVLAAVDDASPPGNLGNLDLQFGFKPPSGVGLSLDAAGLSGGGFLDHDQTRQQYSGLLQLSFHTYKLTAFGLISTVLPSGPGYSLVAMVDAEFPPIELGLGFALTGAGGLLGVNRTAKVDALRAALTAHTLSNLLFPKNPVANAPQLLSELDTLFPAAQGRFIFGPIVRIEWGTPSLLTLDLALVLELPDPIKLVLIAELAILLPTPDEKLVEIHISGLGVIDFGANQGSLDATLHDSRLAKYPMHGGLALRVGWAGNKVFLVAAGGVHPKFQPPPDLPKLDRVGISMPSGAIAKLNLDGYLAVTSNSFQIGAHIDMFVGVDGFGIAGYLNFDTLIQRHPFHFDGDISGGVTLSAGGEDLMGLQLAGSLSGPGPWNAAGSVSFDVLWWTVTKSFHHTFGDPEAAPPAQQVDVAQLVRAALGDTRNFAALLAPGANALASLVAPKAGSMVLAHPGASLSVRQTVAPLGLAITHFGGAAALGDTRFDITAVTVNGAGQTPIQPVLDDFAPGQFLTLSDDEKLASPSFERLPAGAEFSAATLFGAAVVRSIAYETFYADTFDGPLREDTGVPPPFPIFTLQAVLLEGAAARSALARSAGGQYAGPKHLLAPAELDYVVAASDQLAASGVGAATGLSFSQAQAALEKELALHPDRRPGLLVAARYETAA